MDQSEAMKVLPRKYFLKLENLLKGRESASIIDLKMGRNTITCNITSEQKIKKRLKKDKETTSQKLGFKIIGYVIKSNTNEIEEKFYKFPYKNEEQIHHVLRRIFTWPRVLWNSMNQGIEMSYHPPDHETASLNRQSLIGIEHLHDHLPSSFSPSNQMEIIREDDELEVEFDDEN